MYRSLLYPPPPLPISILIIFHLVSHNPLVLCASKLRHLSLSLLFYSPRHIFSLSLSLSLSLFQKAYNILKEATALHVASACGRSFVVESLLKAGADPSLSIQVSCLFIKYSLPRLMLKDCPFGTAFSRMYRERFPLFLYLHHYHLCYLLPLPNSTICRHLYSSYRSGGFVFVCYMEMLSLTRFSLQIHSTDSFPSLSLIESRTCTSCCFITGPHRCVSYLIGCIS